MNRLLIGLVGFLIFLESNIYAHGLYLESYKVFICIILSILVLILSVKFSPKKIHIFWKILIGFFSFTLTMIITLFISLISSM